MDSQIQSNNNDQNLYTSNGLNKFQKAMKYKRRFD